ncbi:sulfotransferase domain-containing protein [Halomicronema hongdechloris]|nr:sulfotransferase domain-containing protein [Halomicronema hongdechloris]
MKDNSKQKDEKSGFFREDDIFLVSYPKSGNTWVRFLIANLVQPNKEVTFLNIDECVPDIHKNSIEEISVNVIERPRIIKSHNLYNPTYKRVIYIVRDPRSVSVSLYHHLIKFFKIPDQYPFEEFVENFIKGNYMSYFGSWDSHVLGWMSGTKNNNTDFICLKYEDLKDETEKELTKVADFLGLKINQELCQRTITASSFNKMRQLESMDWEKSKALSNGNPHKRFVRSGQVDEWKSYFNQESERKLLSKFRPAMEALGYTD